MKFMIMSDTHGSNDFIPEGDYSDVVLIIPGDFDEAKRPRFRTKIESLCKQFKEVVLVPGNHEYYGSNIHKVHKILKEMNFEIPNFSFLQNDYIYIGDVLIVGATLWTDYDRSNALVKFDAKMKMNDYKHIRHGTEAEPWKTKLTVEDVEYMHHISKKYIKMLIDTERELVHNDIKVVVVTHHAPSYQSVSPRYKNDSLNGCYCSDMDQYVADTKADFWIHGHVHDNFDYYIDKTRVLCNPRGYASSIGVHDNKNFNANYIFEV